MGPIIAALAGLAIVAIGIYWFLRANPSTLAKRARLGMVIVAGFGILLVLLAGIEYVLPYLPELFGALGIGIATFVVRALRQRTAGGFGTPGSDSSQRTAVRTDFLDAWIDHQSGDMGASVLKGRFVGRTLDGLAEGELRQLQGECANDQDSLRILESYLDRRLGAGWRHSQEPPANPRTDMSRDQALAVLGLKEGATDEEIRASHRRLIQRVHPDAGGSADLAARINRAKDVLLGH